MRDACFFDVQDEEKRKIGGQGKIVEIDESMFTKRKNHCGRVFPQQWVVGGVCRGTKEMFVECVDDRASETLMNVIWNRVEPGSLIYTSCWKGYPTAELELTKYHHMIVWPVGSPFVTSPSVSKGQPLS